MLRTMSTLGRACAPTRASTAAGIELRGAPLPRSRELLSAQALQLLARLHRRFEARRQQLLDARAERQRELDAGELPQRLPASDAIRSTAWRMAPLPADLAGRRLEITGPAERKTLDHALHASTCTFVADLEDSCSPTWENMIAAQANLYDAVRGRNRELEPEASRAGGSAARAALIVQPRGWHLPEKHVRIDGAAVAAALFDVVLYVVNNFEALARRNAAPYLRLGKLESHQEAQLWEDVLLASEDALGLPHGTIRVSVLIDTVRAAFEMEEILFALRDRAVELRHGRWAYVFSFSKSFRQRPQFVLPDRSSVTPTQPFLRSCAELVGQTARRRGAAQSSPLAATAPVPHAANRDLLRAPDGAITESGVRLCLRVGVQYLEAWLRGTGCLPLDGAHENTATAEVCRAQLWQWMRHGTTSSDGIRVTPERVEHLLLQELDRIHAELGRARLSSGVFPSAARLFEHLIMQERFEEFLTLPAYELLN